MAIYDRQWCREVRAILDKASVLKVEPKQSIEPVKRELPAELKQLAADFVSALAEHPMSHVQVRDRQEVYNEWMTLKVYRPDEGDGKA